MIYKQMTDCDNIFLPTVVSRGISQKHRSHNVHASVFCAFCGANVMRNVIIMAIFCKSLTVVENNVKTQQTCLVDTCNFYQ